MRPPARRAPQKTFWSSTASTAAARSSYACSFSEALSAFSIPAMNRRPCALSYAPTTAVGTVCGVGLAIAYV